MKNFTILPLLLTLLSSPLAAKTLVITDVDDTIKISHVRSILGSIGRAARGTVSFKGMPELFNFLNNEVEDISFHYVSNAPKWLMNRLHKRFLRINSYPAGGLYLQDQYSSKEHKVKTITQIIKSHSPDEVILLGDNGEKDISFYDQITKEIARTLPNTKVHPFIRHVYELPGVLTPTPGQKSFVTPLDILSHLQMASKSSYDKGSINLFAKEQANWIRSESRFYESKSFPRWQKCKNFITHNFFNNSPENRIIFDAFKNVQEVCASDYKNNDEQIAGSFDYWEYWNEEKLLLEEGPDEAFLEWWEEEFGD